jgi:formate hydrogenlyase transcriptional activator
MAPKDKEQGRCQAVIGEHQCERPAGHTGEHREGQNFIERSVILTQGKILRPRLQGLRQIAESEATTLEEAQRDHIHKTLKQTHGIISGSNGAAARLGIKPSTLYFRMQKLGISRSNENCWSMVHQRSHR